MADKKLYDAFVDELRDAYDAEKQLIKALPKMAKAATSDELREAFESHLEETRGQVGRLEQAFEMLGLKARGKHCAGIAGILEEGSDVMEEDFEDATMDACLVASGQRAEHYEMAAYGCLIAWAKTLGHDDVAALLEETLNEEKAADEKLSKLAEGGINDAAAADNGEEEESDDDESKDGEDSKEGASKGRSAGATAGRKADMNSRASAGAKNTGKKR